MDIDELTGQTPVQRTTSLSRPAAGLRQAVLPAVLCLLVIGIFPPVSASEISRTVTVKGVQDAALRKELRAISSLGDRDRTYTSVASIRRTARRDAENIKAALVSKGYYAATVVPVVSREGPKASVSFDVALSEKFRIADYLIRYTAPSDLPRPASFAEAGLKTRGNPDGSVLKKLEEDLLTYLQNRGHPSARASKRFVEANFESRTATAIFEINSGPGTYFGEVVVDGTDITRDRFVSGYVPWETGAVYDKSKVLAYREALQKTGLFTEISLSPAPPRDGIADILLNVKERKRRTIGAGASFATDVGPGGQLFWQNRNLLGRGETVTARLQGSTLEQSFELGLQRPLPRFPGDFATSLKLGNEITDAFDAQSLELATTLSRFAYDRKLKLSAGVGLTYSQVTDRDQTNTNVTDSFVYLTTPVSAGWNSENDLLNPTSGFRTNLTLTPYVGDLNFLRARIGGATRRTFGANGRFIIAGRAALGSSFGIDRDDIPSTERFFAGGGGSVRGFAFQEAGPLDANNDPIGGSSLVEVNFEARAQLRQNLQAAIFVDGGTVSDNNLPDFSEEVLWGAGAGLRYLTPVGPLRVDIATPLNSRDTDDPVQLYISIGQPF